MPRIRDAWGIEVGANAIKTVHLVRNGLKIELADYDVLPFKQILTTPDLNVDEAIQVNLDQFLSRHDLSRSTVMVSVPGHMAFARFAKLPPVEPKRIPDIVKFEAVQQVPFPIDEVEWDYQVFQQEDSPDVGVGIFAITKDRVAQVLANHRAVGLTVHGLTLSPLAVYNALAYDMNLDDSSAGVVFMDIGTSNTDMIIVEGGRIWLRTLPIGGNNFTEALVRAFKLSFPKAEKLKREAGTSKYARQIFQAMRPVFADLVQEIQRSLGYYQSLNREARLTKLIGVGSTFRLPGLQKFLKQQLQIEVIRPDGFSRIASDAKQAADFSDSAMNLATAYGLALQGLDAQRVNANILPKSIIKQRMWRAKQPMLAAAAVLMVLATIASGVRLWLDRSSFATNYDAVETKVEAVIADARKNESAWHEVGRDDISPIDQIANFRRMLDYRDVWPKLLQDISLAAMSLGPQPETLEPNYEKIKAIPRNERRRVYIDSIVARYEVVQPELDEEEEEEEDGTDSPEFQGLTANMLWGGEYDGSPRKIGDDAETDLDDDEQGTGIQPPSFVITIEGTTPYENAPKFLSEHFIGWLKENAERLDRPYRIDTEYLPNPIVFAKKIGNAAVMDGSRRGGAGSELDVSAFGSRNRSRPGRSMRGGMGQVGNRMTQIAGMDESTEPVESLQPLIPVNPLLDEPRADDWRFKIQWKIVLERPEYARQAENVEDRAAAAERAQPVAAISETNPTDDAAARGKESL